MASAIEAKNQSVVTLWFEGSTKVDKRYWEAGPRSVAIFDAKLIFINLVVLVRNKLSA